MYGNSLALSHLKIWYCNNILTTCRPGVFHFFKICLFCNSTFLSLLDTYAMAGMALQCVKNSGSYSHNAEELNLTLNKIKQKLLASRRSDGHIGNEFSTGLAVQVRSYLFSVLTIFPCFCIKP